MRLVEVVVSIYIGNLEHLRSFGRDCEGGASSFFSSFLFTLELVPIWPITKRSPEGIEVRLGQLVTRESNRGWEVRGGVDLVWEE